MIGKQAARHTLSEVCAVQLKPPDGAGDRWEGISHRLLVSHLCGAFRAKGLTLIDFRGHLSRDGQDAALGWAVRDWPGWAHGVTAGFALTGSNARRHALKFYAGLFDTVTGTPLVTDQIRGWRFVKGVDPVGECWRVVSEWEGAVAKAGTVMSRLPLVPLPPEAAYRALLTAAREDALPWHKLGRVDAAWRKGGDQTRWGLLKAFWTHVATTPAQDQMSRCHSFAGLLT